MTVKIVTDSARNPLYVGDCVYYGERAGSKSARGVCKVGRITKIEGRYITVNSTYYRMEGTSARKCTARFADMFNDGSIFEV